MTNKLDDRIIKELHENAEKFYRCEWILDTRAINNNRFLSATHFEMDFNSALDKFRRETPSDNWSYLNACEEFHEELTKAKTLNVIIEKQSKIELENHKQKIMDLENKLKDANTKVDSLLEEKGFLKGRLDVYERDLPKSDTLIGDVDD
jgi:hypothetical protein